MHIGPRPATILAVAFLGTLAGAQPAARAEPAFDTVWAFGDSLTDTGNLFALTTATLGIGIPPPPYFEGRFSNGPVWIEHFVAADQLDAALVNLAFAGATTGATGILPGADPSILLPTGVLGPLQVGSIQHPAFDADDLVVLWAGANDIVFGFGAAETTTTNLETAVVRLAELGAGTFLVFNLPDFGRTPDGATSGAAQALSAAAATHNAMLAARMSRVAAERGVDIVLVDIHTAFGQILGNPGRFGFTNTTDACFDPDAGTVCANPDEFVSWDGFHPTAAAHELISEFAFATLNSPSRGALVVAGAGEIGTMNARRHGRIIASRLSTARMGASGFGLLGSGFGGGTSLERRLTLADDRSARRAPVDGYWLPLEHTPDGLPASRPRLSIFLHREDDDGRRPGGAGFAGYGYAAETRSVGLDIRLAERVLLGMMYSRSDGTATFDAGASTDLVDNGFAMYASYGQGGFRSDLSLGISETGYDRIARSTGSRLFPLATGSTRGITTHGDLETGYDIDFGPVSAGPIGGLRWSRTAIDGYRETGAGPLNLTYGTRAVEETTGRLGLQAAAALETLAGPIAAEFAMTWSRRLDGNRDPVTASLADGHASSLNGETGDGDALRVDAGVAMGLAPGATGMLAIESTLGGDRGTEHEARASLTLRF